MTEIKKLCKNPKCGKEVQENLNYCSEQCLREHINAKNEIKTKKIENIKKIEKDNDTIPPNLGTKAKQKLQIYALILIKSYGKQRSLDDIADLLSWDIFISARTALDSYIIPMFKHNLIIQTKDNYFCINENTENKIGKLESDN